MTIEVAVVVVGWWYLDLPGPQFHVVRGQVATWSDSKPTKFCGIRLRLRTPAFLVSVICGRQQSPFPAPRLHFQLLHGVRDALCGFFSGVFYILLMICFIQTNNKII